MPVTVKCPSCQKDVEWSVSSEWKPFCSERCRLIDLGAWADEKYKVASEESPMSEGMGESEN